MPVREIVEEGVRLAIELARDPTVPREPTVTLRTPSLIVRQSTAVPPA
jgi:DNA-binding LacI/PurR family transcriptional regulator